MNTKKFCHNCGQPLIDGSRFCSSCGHALDDPRPSEKVEETPVPAQAQAQTPTDVAPPPPSPAPSPQEAIAPPGPRAERPIPVLLIGSLVILGLAVLAVVIFLALRQRPVEKAQAAPPVAEVAATETLFVARETRVRSGPTPEGTTVLQTLQRGATVQGRWTTGPNNAPWLEMEWQGRPAFVWGANLTNMALPALSTAEARSLATLQSTTMRAQPTETAQSLEAVAAGVTLQTQGLTADGWREVARSGGGVGYVRDAELGPPLVTLKVDSYGFDMPRLYPTAWPRWKSALRQAGFQQQPWLFDASGVAGPMKTVNIGGRVYHHGYVCQPHNCGNNNMDVLVRPDQTRIVGRVQITNDLTYQSSSWLVGQPNDAEATCLEWLARSPEGSVC